ncbi:1-acyl-sn-glycerol-3-phosphate acyltransferase [Candidatus Chlamydia sanziniae]|uniref:Glycerol-3-phosphate acyltransferase n=1 Tax=Candidatus Chlamydia sanziniae TaxID=1806891 RepID=A0A1A9HXD4_9CHLA|nr:1-acyl-sn-glycerol-3-phosphate acyltransferase [Candidatus Chlamydia sanziniae]ANH78752.1 Glycerol-3-phosphate acyltransferase [Candidatus Chlamydia sanziniae]
MHFSTYLQQALNGQCLPEPLYQKFCVFHQNYIDAATKKCSVPRAEALCLQWLKVILDDLKNPFIFPAYHRKIRSPIDLFTLSIDFFSVVIDDDHSRVLNIDRFNEIQKYLSRGDNVILLANHQTECDPHLMYCILGQTYPELMEKIIFIAGDRVTSDPLARPFSMGCDLLRIYSKRHINTPPELREGKLHHNQKSMKILKTLLHEGAKLIYVAPSGGRDRKNQAGELFPAEFDPESIEMFRLLAKSSGQVTHFYPFALKTYDILPPPPKIEETIGEERVIFFAPVFFNIGNELDLNQLYSKDDVSYDKHQQRVLRAKKIFSIVKELYEEF